MPIVLTAPNSPILTDSQSSFIGGQFSNAVPLQLDQTSCSLLENAETSTTGQAKSRRGTIQLGGAVGSLANPISFLEYYKTGASDYPVAFMSAAGGAFKLAAGAWSALSNGTPPSGTVVSTAVGNTFLYAVQGSAGSGNIYRWDGTTWTTLSTDTPPANCTIILWDGFRLVASGQAAAPGAIYFSGQLNDALWASVPGGYQIIPGGDQGVPITAILPWNGTNLAVFKRNQVWNVGADPALNVSDFPIQRIHMRIGCVATNTAVQCGSDILFLASDGVRSLQQTLASDNFFQLQPPLSFPVQDFIERINPSALSQACAIFWKGRYYLSVALDGSTTNNYILVYNTITSKWNGGWTNLPVQYFRARTDTSAGVDKMIMGSSLSNIVLEYLDYVAEVNATDATYTDYNNVVVPFHVKTRGMMFGDLDSPKKGLNMNMKLYRSKGQISVTAIFDEGELSDTKIIDTGDPTGLTFPIFFPAIFARGGVEAASMTLMKYPRFHQVQFEVKAVTAGRKEIRQITAQAFPEAVDLRGKFTALG